MEPTGWVVVANVGQSAAAERTDSCGDMEELELMELILVSEHDTKEAAEQACAVKRVHKDGWAYAVLSRRDYDARMQTAGAGAA